MCIYPILYSQSVVRAEGRRGGVPSVVQLLSYKCGLCQPPCDGKRSSSPSVLCPLHGPIGARMQCLCPAPASGLWQDVKVLSASSQLPGVGAFSTCSLLPSTLHPPSVPPHDCCHLPSSLHFTPTLHLGCILFPSTLHPPPPPQLQSPPLHPASPSLPHTSLLLCLLFSGEPTFPSLPCPNCRFPPPAYTPSIPAAISSLPVCSLLSSLQAPPLAKMTAQLFNVGVVSPFCALFAQLLRL